MPFIKLQADGVAVRRKRLLISGEPNTRKTTSLLTLPKPLAILSFPGEKGYDTIPLNDPQILPFIWQADETKKPDSHAILREVFNASTDLISGKHGKITSFSGDGLHKFFDYLLDSVTDGAYFAGEEFEPKLYGLAYREFTEYLSRVMHTSIPIVAFTCWAEAEGDRTKKPGEKASDIPSHIWPALPGKLAKKILGEFSVAVHQTLRRDKLSDSETQGMWQTRPSGEVWGCGIKGPTEVVKRIPTYVPADYGIFTQLWEKAEKEATHA